MTPLRRTPLRRAPWRRRMKRDLLDGLFSQYIRRRDRWTCQRCGTGYPQGGPALHCAHVFTRGKQSVRYDPLNATSLCRGCHAYLDEGQMRHPTPEQDRVSRWRAWYVLKHGEQAYDLLRLRAMKPGKPDRAAILLWLRQALATAG